MSKGVNGPGLAMFGIGSVLVYSGMKGYSMLAVIQNLVTGKPIHTGVVAAPLTAPSASTPDVNADSTSAAGAKGTPRALGQSQAAALGWTGSEWSALDALWERESGWNPRASNPSGAYGIPQALPYSKMPKAAWPESAGGKSDAGTQIEWGLSYIGSRYGKPSMAKAHSDANGWY